MNMLTDRELRELFLDWKNNYLTTPVFAEHYGITDSRAHTLINAGRVLHEHHCERVAHERHCERLENNGTTEQHIMTIIEIFEKYTPGSTGFCLAVQTHCAGYDLSRAEIERLANRCKTAAKFNDAWENDTWWCDQSTKSR